MMGHVLEKSFLLDKSLLTMWTGMREHFLMNTEMTIQILAIIIIVINMLCYVAL